MKKFQVTALAAALVATVVVGCSSSNEVGSQQKHDTVISSWTPSLVKEYGVDHFEQLDNGKMLAYVNPPGGTADVVTLEEVQFQDGGMGMRASSEHGGEAVLGIVHTWPIVASSGNGGGYLFHDHALASDDLKWRSSDSTAFALTAFYYELLGTEQGKASLGDIDVEVSFRKVDTGGGTPPPTGPGAPLGPKALARCKALVAAPQSAQIGTLDDAPVEFECDIVTDEEINILQGDIDKRQSRLDCIKAGFDALGTTVACGICFYTIISQIVVAATGVGAPLSIGGFLISGPSCFYCGFSVPDLRSKINAVIQRCW